MHSKYQKGWRRRLLGALVGHDRWVCWCGADHASLDEPKRPRPALWFRTGSRWHYRPIVDEIKVNGVRISMAVLDHMTEPDETALYAYRRDGEMLILHVWRGVEPRWEEVKRGNPT